MKFSPTETPTIFWTNKNIPLSTFSNDLIDILGENRWENSTDKKGLSGVTQFADDNWKENMKQSKYAIVINYTLDGINGFPIQVSKDQEKSIYDLISSYE